jgi:hypothetical protein
MINRIPYIIIAGLVLLIIMMRSCDSFDEKKPANIITKTDTTYRSIHDTITKTVREVSVKYVPFKIYKPSKNIDTCNSRLDSLLMEHSMMRAYRDTLSIDSVGTVVVLDTVWRNKLSGRTYISNYTVPTITNTITKTEDPKRQLYIGGNIFADKRILHIFSSGLIYKDRKDRVYQANIGVTMDGNISYGLGTYWKIKLKK